MDQPDFAARLAEQERIEAYVRRIRGARPRATWALLALNIAIGVAVQIPYPPLGRQLLLEGSLVSGLVFEGEPWRLLTTMFLHVPIFGVPLHLALNMFGLWVLGPFVEALYGPRRFLGIYFISGLGACVVSLAFLPEAPTVGASGALFGLIGLIAGLTLLNRGLLPRVVERRLGRNVLIVIGLNLMLGLSIPIINNHAHVGGLITGVGLSLVILPRLPGARHKARARTPVAAAMVVAAAALAGMAHRNATLPLLHALDYTQWAYDHRPHGLARAASLLERAMDDMPELPPALRADLLNTLAWTYVLLERELPRAEQMAQEAVSLVPDQPAYLDTLAYLEAAEGRCDSARAMMDRAVALDPGFALRRREIVEACASGRYPDPDAPMVEPDAGPDSEVLWTRPLAPTGGYTPTAASSRTPSA